MVENNFHNSKEDRQTREPIRLGHGQRIILSDFYEGSTVAIFCHTEMQKGLILLSKDPEAELSPKAVRFKNQNEVHGQVVDESAPIIIDGQQVVVIHHPNSDEIIKVRLVEPDGVDKPCLQLEFDQTEVATEQPNLVA